MLDFQHKNLKSKTFCRVPGVKEIGFGIVDGVKDAENCVEIMNFKVLFDRVDPQDKQDFIIQFIVVSEPAVGVKTFCGVCFNAC